MQHRTKRDTSMPLMTIQATPAEVIVLQAALHHYQRYIADDRQLAQGVPLIQHFIQRLHDQLPPRQERIGGA